MRAPASGGRRGIKIASAVRKEYQRKGIGRTLLRLTKEQAGHQSMLLLLSAPEAMEYYPKLQLDKVESGFIIHRVR